MPALFHIVDAGQWQAASELGRYAPESLAAAGFVHFSFRHQVAQVANVRYADRDGLIVIEIDPADLDSPVVLEDLYDAGEEFPHIYAAIPTAAERARHSLVRDRAGRWTFPLDRGPD